MYISSENGVNITLVARLTELRMWLLVHAGFCYTLLAVLARVTRTQDILTTLLVVFGMLSLLVLWAYHRADVATAVAKASSDTFCSLSSTVPPCGGVFGRGGVVQSFVSFAVYATLYGSKIVSMWVQCSAHGEQLHADGATVSLFIGSFVAYCVAVWFVEVARFADDDTQEGDA